MYAKYLLWLELITDTANFVLFLRFCIITGSYETKVPPAGL